MVFIYFVITSRNKISCFNIKVNIIWWLDSIFQTIQISDLLGERCSWSFYNNTKIKIKW